jgi:hypothetical protein
MPLFCIARANIEQKQRTINDTGDDNNAAATLIFRSSQQLLRLLKTNFDMKFHPIGQEKD